MSNSTETKTGVMEPGCALPAAIWVSCMYIKISSCIFLWDESNGKGTLRALSKLLDRLGEGFTLGLTFSPAQPFNSHSVWLSWPSPWLAWESPCQTYKRLYRVSDIKDFWLILLVFHCGSNSLCIFYFAFILDYAKISGGKSSERVFFPPTRQYFVGEVLLSVKENKS